jgi:PAXNEB protein
MSFRRAKQSAASSPLGEKADVQKQVSGVRPWINGGYLVSTGNRALDNLFGGGQGLGTVLMLESDCFSGYADTILSYNVAQAVSSGHSVLVITDSISSPEGIASLLPYNQNVGKGLESDTPIQTTDENDSESHGEVSSCSDKSHSCNSDCKSDPASGLKIAWQYEKYVVKGCAVSPLFQFYSRSLNH